jgi:hypothetical protein
MDYTLSPVFLFDVEITVQREVTFFLLLITSMSIGISLDRMGSELDLYVIASQISTGLVLHDDEKGFDSL